MPPKLAELLEMLSLVRDRQERIDLLISLAERFQPATLEGPLPEESRVPGCESEVFVFAKPLRAGLKFDFVVQNPQGVSAKALAVILDETLSGEDLKGVAEVPESVVYDIFGRELSMGKSMGLMNTVRMVKALALRAAG
ncbi:MAG TPA: SufE family protein [Fimbriimonadaceae bacterium]|nr:SufE family protein [Fimbriimonadaceae bacterium]